MVSKKVITLGMVVGSLVGGFLPSLFGFNGMFTSLLTSSIGAVIGIILAYKIEPLTMYFPSVIWVQARLICGTRLCIITLLQLSG